MLRAEKAQVIDDLNEVFAKTGVVVVTHYKGLTVAEITELRGRMRAAGGTFRVTKNRLAKRALDGTPFAAMAPLFTGPTAIAFSNDPMAAPQDRRRVRARRTTSCRSSAAASLARCSMRLRCGRWPSCRRSTSCAPS